MRNTPPPLPPGIKLWPNWKGQLSYFSRDVDANAAVVAVTFESPLSVPAPPAPAPVALPIFASMPLLYMCSCGKHPRTHEIMRRVKGVNRR